MNTNAVGLIVKAGLYSPVWHLKSEITNRNSAGIQKECQLIASEAMGLFGK